jgi:hypothetical protein
LNGKLVHHSGGIVYAVTSSMNMNESAVNMHNVPHYSSQVSIGLVDTALDYETSDLGSIPGTVY